MTTELRETTWSRLGVGSVIVDPKTEERWRVVETAVPAQYEYGHSNWLRVVDANGEIHSIPPRPMGKKVTILFDPEAEPVEPAWPTGAKEVALLVESLGATELGTQDLATGEIWCPTHDFDPQKALDHLRLAHGIDVTGIDTTEKRTAIHGRCHNPAKPLGKGGFAHRHMPEDLGFIPT